MSNVNKSCNALRATGRTNCFIIALDLSRSLNFVGAWWGSIGRTSRDGLALHVMFDFDVFV